MPKHTGGPTRLCALKHSDWPFAKAPRHNTTCIAALPARTHRISSPAPIQTPPRANPSPSCSLMQHHQCHLTPSQLMPVPARALLLAKDLPAATARSKSTKPRPAPLPCQHHSHVLHPPPGPRTHFRPMTICPRGPVPEPFPFVPALVMPVVPTVLKHS